jgi:hypothetical protein
MSDTFLDDEDINLKPLDCNKLSDDSLCIYNVYLEITGLKELPESDFVLLSQVARDYFISSFCKEIRNISKNDSFIKAKNEGRIKNFNYMMGWLNLLNNTRIKKKIYNQKFENVEKFIEDNEKNEGFLILKDFMDKNKMPIIGIEDTKNMYDIFSIYTSEEINNAINNCKDYKGNNIYDLKFLLYIVKKNRSDNERLSEIWVKEQQDMNVNINMLDIEKNYIEPENEEEKEYYKNKNKELIEELMKMIKGTNNEI